MALSNAYVLPTNRIARYHDYRDHSRSKAVMADALREAYGDIFLITANPKPGDRTAVEGKFKSFHNVSDNVAQLMTKTFYALLNMSDLNAPATTAIPKPSSDEDVNNDASASQVERAHVSNGMGVFTGFHYNIQVHLPATKDVEVYNAIFKSLKEHFVE